MKGVYPISHDVKSISSCTRKIPRDEVVISQHNSIKSHKSYLSEEKYFYSNKSLSKSKQSGGGESNEIDNETLYYEGFLNETKNEEGEVEIIKVRCIHHPPSDSDNSDESDRSLSSRSKL